MRAILNEFKVARNLLASLLHCLAPFLPPFLLLWPGPQWQDFFSMPSKTDSYLLIFVYCSSLFIWLIHVYRMSDFVTPPMQHWRVPVTAANARRADEQPDETLLTASYTWSQTRAFQARFFLYSYLNNNILGYGRRWRLLWHNWPRSHGAVLSQKTLITPQFFFTKFSFRNWSHLSTLRCQRAFRPRCGKILADGRRASSFR